MKFFKSTGSWLNENASDIWMYIIFCIFSILAITLTTMLILGINGSISELKHRKSMINKAGLSGINVCGHLRTTDLDNLSRSSIMAEAENNQCRDSGNTFLHLV